MGTNSKQILKNKKMIIEKMKNIAESSPSDINKNLLNAYHSDVEWRGFYPLEDLKGLEKNDIAALLQATAEVNKIRVERALGIVRAIKVPEEVESLEEAVKKARGSDGKIDTISIGEIELTI